MIFLLSDGKLAMKKKILKANLDDAFQFIYLKQLELLEEELAYLDSLNSRPSNG